MHIATINKALRHFISASIAANILVLVLVIDYSTRNSSDIAYTSLADVLTLALILSFTVTVFAIIGALMRARGDFRAIESSTWILLACWMAILAGTLPLEERITSQSYRRGA